MLSRLRGIVLLYLHGLVLLTDACSEAVCEATTGSSLIQKNSQASDTIAQSNPSEATSDTDNENATLPLSSEDLVPDDAEDLTTETATSIGENLAGTFIGHDPPKPTCRTREDPRAWSSFYTTSPPGTPCVFGVDDRDEGGHCIISDGKYGSAGWCFTSRDRSSFGSCIDTCPLFGQIGALAKELKKERRREIEEELGVISKMFDRMYALHSHSRSGELEASIRSKTEAIKAQKQPLDSSVSWKPNSNWHGRDRRVASTTAEPIDPVDANDDYDPLQPHIDYVPARASDGIRVEPAWKGASEIPSYPGHSDDPVEIVDEKELQKVVNEIVNRLDPPVPEATVVHELNPTSSDAKLENHHKRALHRRHSDDPVETVDEEKELQKVVNEIDYQLHPLVLETQGVHELNPTSSDAKLENHRKQALHRWHHKATDGKQFN